MSKSKSSRRSKPVRRRQSHHPHHPQQQTAASPEEPQSEPQSCRGLLELHASGYGFLRCSEKGFARRQDDVFVPETLIHRFQLRQGSTIVGRGVSNRTGRRLVHIEQIDDGVAEPDVPVVAFDDRTPTNPRQWLKLEHPDQPVSMRVLDLLCPFGLGQRALIAAPPRAGKTTLLKQIGRSVSLNRPDLQLMVLLIDERPEEVTDMRDEISGEVFASSLDHDVENHARLSKLVIDRCQRLVERGKDVVLLVDSLTRMSRAFNKLRCAPGPIGAGGLNIRALDVPRRLFASARPFVEGGSLTIIATVLVETDNRMDEVIFREFKGTGNLDLVLSQQLADRCIWPALDLAQSATRRAELIHDPTTLQAMTALRRTLSSMHPAEAIEELTAKLKRTVTNASFVELIKSAIG